MGDSGHASTLGVQHGDHNVQHNYFAPVTKNLFSGTFERLQDVCFDPAVLERDLDLVRFTGREWLIRQIDEFVGIRRRGYVLVLGEAGVGKSSLAAHLVGTRPWLHHFTRLAGGRSPEAARKSLSAQLIARWQLSEWAPGGVLPKAADRPDWFDRLLHAAARQRDDREPDEPIVLVVDGLDEAEPRADADMPLGLPTSLPEGVFIIATSRLGIDRNLHAVRNPVDWLQIEVEGVENQDDMRQFINDVTDPNDGDRRLAAALIANGISFSWFRQTLAERCSGVWIYLRYVLDEIRDGTRNPQHIDQLPADLAGYYAEQIERWRGASTDLNTQDRWERVGLPLLGVLGAARAPLTVQELALFSGVSGESAVQTFVGETARAFLSRQDDPLGPARYGVRHQSLRDLLIGVRPDGRPDLRDLVEIFAGQHCLAHRKIVLALIPPGAAGERTWQGVGTYARDHLAAHAAESGLLDELVCDPGFLTVVTPGSVFTQRRKLCSQDGERALAALEMSLNGWDLLSERERGERLVINAARVRASSLVSACAKATSTEWAIRWAAWSGHGHRTLTGGGGGGVQNVAIGRAGKREVILSISNSGSVQVWDAVTGDPVDSPLTRHNAAVRSVAIGRARDRDVIVCGTDGGTVHVWDAMTGEAIGRPLTSNGGPVRAVEIGRAGDRDVIVSGSKDGIVRVWDAVTWRSGWPTATGLRSQRASVGDWASREPRYRHRRLRRHLRL